MYQRAPSPYGNRAPSPYGNRASSPYAPEHQQLPSGPAQVGPGSVTYTTSTGPDGRVLYHPFKAVAASYQTPNGVVSGIQWIPAEATTVVPAGATLANPSGSNDYSGSWHSGGYAHKEEQKSTQDWQRTDEKRRKQEEKEAKRLREQGATRNESEYELRKARERNTQPPGVAFPGSGNPGYPSHPSVATGYPSSPYSGYAALNPPPGGPIPPYGSANVGHNRNPSENYDIARQFNDLDIDRGREQTVERDRKISGGHGRPRKYSTSDAPYAPRAVSPNPYAVASGSYTPASGPYSNPKLASGPGANAYSNPHYTSPSPNMRPSEMPYGSTGPSGYPASTYASSPARNPAELIGRSTTPFGGPSPQVYPRGHVLEGQPITSNNPRSRAPSPNPGAFPQGNASPHMGGRSPNMPHATIPGDPQQLPAPEGFSRPINAANSFVPFDIMKIQDMEALYEQKIAKMPLVLTTHDIHQEDWKRCIQDLARSWTGQLPVPGFGRDGRPPKRSTLAADLIDLWNASYFLPRGAELILYKGRERRTGPKAGQIDPQLPHYHDSDDSTSSTESSDSDLSDYGNRMAGPYGRPAIGPTAMAEMAEARRRRHEEKQDKRRRRKEKRARRKAKARDKAYSVYITCLPRGGANSFSPGMMPGNYAMPMAPGGYAGAPGGYGIPTNHSQGY
ncbi:hypothetical protein B0H34DRAFT_220908 [Crassisporium funariophilum]|nr:hypothetical protein B0H34DRAFT_220908 [Crassisporium funariophilum]